MRFKAKKFRICYIAHFQSLANKSDLLLWAARPQDSSYQRIDKVVFSHSPVNSYRDKQENEILYFRFKDFHKLYFSIEIEAELRQAELEKKDLLSICKDSITNKRWLADEKYLRQTNEIKALAEKLTAQIHSPIDKIHTIYEFIATNFAYEYPVSKRGVENLSFDNLRGDCGESSSLFVALCRLLKIPARNNTGFIIFPNKNSIVEHGWANFCSQEHGWVDVDCQYTSLEKNDKNANIYFAQRPDYRLNFTNGFNIALKPKIPSNYSLEYWNALGLSVSNDSVQTLQPLVFASKNRVEFSDKIILK